jgi:hypothetical protein
VRRLRHHAPLSIKDRARKVTALLDICRECASTERRSHFFGNSGATIAEHFQINRINRWIDRERKHMRTSSLVFYFSCGTIQEKEVA